MRRFVMRSKTILWLLAVLAIVWIVFHVDDIEAALRRERGVMPAIKALLGVN